MVAAHVRDLAKWVANEPDTFIDERDRRRLSAFTKRMVTGYDQSPHIVDHLVPELEWAVATPDARLIVTMPPRHSKSLHVSENLPAWFLGNHPDRRIISASHTAALAYTFSRRVRNKMIDPRWPFPNVQVADDKGAVQAWDIADNTGGYIAVGVGGSPTGHGGNLVIDDPIRSAADADSMVMREGLWEWYRETMRTRLEPGGFIILTATRWHEDDLTGRLLSEMANGGEQWRHLHLPAIDETGNALWPGRWALDALDAIKSAVGTRAWEAQYQGSPTPAEGGILKREWFGYYPAPDKSYSSIVQAWDTSFKIGESNDFSACVTLGVGTHYFDVLDVFQAKLEFPDLERSLEEQHLIWRSRYPIVPFTVAVEDKASGQSLIQAARRRGNRNINVIAIPASRPNEKLQRVNEISPTVEALRVRLPLQSPNLNASWLDSFLHEVTSFPFAKHDDILDAFAIALRRGIGIDSTGSGASDESYWAQANDEKSAIRRARRLRR